MRLLNAVRCKAVGLTVLAIVCVVVEQAIYCVILPAYFFQLLVSPVFWSSISLLCFTGLWWMDQQYPIADIPKKSDNEMQEQQTGYYDPWSYDNPLNMCRGFGSWL